MPVDPALKKLADEYKNSKASYTGSPTPQPQNPDFSDNFADKAINNKITSAPASPSPSPIKRRLDSY